ncbi:protein kinase domain-containing protein [Haliangium ochraceum]
MDGLAGSNPYVVSYISTGRSGRIWTPCCTVWYAQNQTVRVWYRRKSWLPYAGSGAQSMSSTMMAPVGEEAQTSRIEPSRARGGNGRARRRQRVLHCLHRYRIQRLIGKGYTGMVYEARGLVPDDQSMPVACKLGCDDFRDLPSYRDYIRRVGALGRRLTGNHGNLVTVLEQFEDTRGGPCLVMELIDGCSVADLHASHRRLPFSVIRRIVMDILSALAYLHSKQVLLIDLSPPNVLVSTRGEVKVTALNLVRIEEERQARSRALGDKIAYASPERLQAFMIDARADLYSLGAVLFELLTGQLLTKPENGVRLPADIPDDLAMLTLGLLQKGPEACRPHRADEALEFLRRSVEPVASRAELGDLVIVTQHGQRDPMAGGAHTGHMSEILEPGHLLVRRSTIVWEQAALDAKKAVRAVPPHRSTKSTLLIHRDGDWRAALIVMLMAGCVALGALLHSSFVAWNSHHRPATTVEPR